MIVAKPINSDMKPGKLAIGIEKRWITLNSLLQQFDYLKMKASLLADIETQPYKKTFGARVKVERGDVARRGTFDRVLFTWREFCLQLVRNGFGDLALNGEDISQIAIVGLRPQMPIAASIN